VKGRTLYSGGEFSLRPDLKRSCSSRERTFLSEGENAFTVMLTRTGKGRLVNHFTMGGEGKGGNGPSKTRTGRRRRLLLASWEGKGIKSCAAEGKNGGTVLLHCLRRKEEQPDLKKCSSMRKGNPYAEPFREERRERRAGVVSSRWRGKGSALS